MAGVSPAIHIAGVGNGGLTPPCLKAVTQADLHGFLKKEIRISTNGTAASWQALVPGFQPGTKESAP
jgi:hypothetical protein